MNEKYLTKLEKHYLAVLAKRILAGVEGVSFNMDYLAAKEGERGEYIHLSPEKVRGCGTCCCALGHAPLCEELPKPIRGESWGNYSARLFPSLGPELDEGENEFARQWCFLFGGSWSNSRSSFAKRAMVALTTEMSQWYEVAERYDLDHEKAPAAADFNPWILTGAESAKLERGES
jgi:hypothetical protein